MTSPDLLGCVTRSLEVRYKISSGALQDLSAPIDSPKSFKMSRWDGALQDGYHPLQKISVPTTCPLRGRLSRKTGLSQPVSTSMPYFKPAPLDSPRWWPHGTPHGPSDPTEDYFENRTAHRLPNLSQSPNHHPIFKPPDLSEINAAVRMSRMQASGICPEGCHMVSGSNRGFPFLDWKP